MTMAWSPIVLNDVAADGILTQLFPDTVTAGSGATTSGTEVRYACEGVLLRAEVYTNDGTGGEIELWDVAGDAEGGDNDVNVDVEITNAYLLAQKALGRARLIWKQGFSGTVGSRYPVFNQRVPFMHGLAARFIVAAPGDKEITLSLVCDGGYRKVQICGA